MDLPQLNEGFYLFWARAYNACGWNDWIETEIEYADCSQMFLMFSPNPTTGETTLSIESRSEEKTFDETAEWDLEVYSPVQSLKQKKQN